MGTTDASREILDKTAEVGPFEISPDEIWIYRVSLLPHTVAIAARKQELQQRPKHVGFLGSIARELVYTGKTIEAQSFLEHQHLADSEGISSGYTYSVIAAYQGRLRLGSEAFGTTIITGQGAAFTNGLMSFINGDIALSETAYQNYQQKRFMSHNNLWPSE